MAWIIIRCLEPVLTKKHSNNIFTLWDSSRALPDNEGFVYFWNGYAETSSVNSLLHYVEIHGVRLRQKYLAWIHDFGEYQINGKRIIDHLAFEDGLSYWWMTLFAEKSPWKSPSITDAIRLLALEEIIVQLKVSKLRLVSANKDLNKVLRMLCKNLDISYEWERVPKRVLRPLSLKSVYQGLPKSIQALSSLIRYVCNRWPLSRSEKSNWFGDDKSLFCCSYFFNVSIKLAEEGQFHSSYWGKLQTLLQEKGVHWNWLQIYYPHDGIPTPRVAMDYLDCFNQQREKQGCHAFLDAYLSWRLVLRVINRWFKLVLITWRLGKIRQAFHLKDSRLSLWLLMREDWNKSIYGSIAINNLLWIELFDVVLRELPHQKKGLYLCENQAWERAFIHAWRKHGHGQLIAVAHATVRFWDFRYFTDSRNTCTSGLHSMPQPDLVALNGEVALDAYLGVDFPKESIVKCEALRYVYLNNLKDKAPLMRTKGNELKVLILGDYESSETMKMLYLLEATVQYISVPITFTMKAHPNFSIKAEACPSLHLGFATDSLENILCNFDVAYSSNSTSAAVDAYLVGLSVVVMLDDAKLNYSPLRGRHGVSFVSTAEELAEALHAPPRNPSDKLDSGEFFFLDPDLPRWQRLLSHRESI